MPPKLILIRHAEAEHNATENWYLHDPLLTIKGEEQCRSLQKHLQSHCRLASEVELIITSPLRRTLQTTLLGLDWLIKQGVPVEVEAMWQENSDSPCDTGSDIEKIALEFPSLDFSALDPVFPDKSASTPYAFTRSATAARGQKCLQTLYSRPEKVIAVVSHSAFLRTAVSKRRYANADYRIFTFRSRKDGGFGLVEDGSTSSSEHGGPDGPGGGGMGRSRKAVQKAEEWDFPPEEVGEAEGVR